MHDLRWLSHWDQGAWGLALAVASGIASTYAVVRAQLSGRNVERSLARMRFVEVLIRLEIAAEDLATARTSRTQFDRCIATWRTVVGELEALAPMVRRRPKKLAELEGAVFEIASMIVDSRTLMDNGTNVAEAAQKLRYRVEDARDLAAGVRVTLTSRRPR